MLTENSYTPTVCDNDQKKEPLQFVSQEIGRAFLFLITLSLLGLTFPPAYIFLALILFTSYIRYKYDFLIQITFLLGGGFGFFDMLEIFQFRLSDIALLLSFITIMLYHRDKTLNRLLLFTFVYIVVLFVFAMMSEESMRIQIHSMREYWLIIYFMVPLLIFADRNFDIKLFYRKLLTYAFIIAIFYCIDSIVFGSNVLVPRTYLPSRIYPKYYDLSYDIGGFLRKYPPGLFLLALCIFPVLKLYSLKISHIIVFVLALITSRTMTMIGGVVITVLCFAKNFKLLLKYFCLGIVLFFVAYHVDEKMNGELRVVQLVEQFSVLKTTDDPEALAKFGTGRMAQILPKIDHLLALNREYIGFGFLVNGKTTNTKYVIINDFYGREEVATDVEVAQIQTILDIGIIGFILHTFYFLAIYFWVLRPLPYSKSYLMALLCISIIGLGGYTGLRYREGLLLLGLNVGIILLADKQQYKNEDYESNT